MGASSFSEPIKVRARAVSSPTVSGGKASRTPAETRALDLALAWTGLASRVNARTINGVREALPPETVGDETARARTLIGSEKELAPIVYIDDPLMKQTVASVRGNGANGVNFFLYKSNWAELVEPALAG